MSNLKYATLLVASQPVDDRGINSLVDGQSLPSDSPAVRQTQLLRQEQWKHLLIQTHQEPLDIGPTLMKPVPDPQIILRTSGYSSAQLTANGRTHYFKPHPGALFLTAAHQEPYEYQRTRLSDQPVRTTHLYVSSQLLSQTATETFGVDGNRIELREGSCFVDPLLRQLTYALGNELEQPAAGHSLYTETAAQLVAVQLIRQHSTVSNLLSEYRSKLHAHCLRQLDEYIEAHLSQPIMLDALAGIACLSAYHFCRVFKRTLGVSPNQYVIRLRLTRAQQLLRTGLPVAQVASLVGYASTNHFTRLFHQYVGCLPSQFR